MSVSRCTRAVVSQVPCVIPRDLFPSRERRCDFRFPVLLAYVLSAAALVACTDAPLAPPTPTHGDAPVADDAQRDGRARTPLSGGATTVFDVSANAFE